MRKKFLYWTTLSVCFVGVFTYVQFNDFIFSKVLLPAQSVLLTVTVLPPGTITNPPTITLLGDNPATVTVNSVFNDPGATAYDTEEGDLTSRIERTGVLDTATVGSYVLHYSVMDSDRKTASVDRAVSVISNGSHGGGGGAGGAVSSTNFRLTMAEIDFNGDGKIDISDFSILAYWYKRPLTSEARARVDLNHDGAVDIVDFSILAYYWNR